MVLDNIGEAGQIKRRVYQRRLPEDPNKDYYYIIRETTPTEAILIEYGFIDNKNDLVKLQNNLEDYAEGVVKAIATYTNTPYYAPGSNSNYYIVQKGDTLWGISQKYNISVDELKTLNNLTSNTISVGQKLIVSTVPSEHIIYTVQKGDSLWGIAQRYGISVNDLIQANNLSNLTIYVGQELIIPVSSKEYTVQAGDTLWGIAQRYGINVNDLIQSNNLSDSTIYVGQVLMIPNSSIKEYIVQAGDTLWGVAQKYNTTVDDLIQKNGLVSTVISPGQTLIIP